MAHLAQMNQIGKSLVNLSRSLQQLTTSILNHIAKPSISVSNYVPVPEPFIVEIPDTQDISKGENLEKECLDQEEEGSDEAVIDPTVAANALKSIEKWMFSSWRQSKW